MGWNRPNFEQVHSMSTRKTLSVTEITDKRKQTSYHRWTVTATYMIASKSSSPVQQAYPIFLSHVANDDTDHPSRPSLFSFLAVPSSLPNSRTEGPW